jgi:hypothetical protein
MGSVVSRGFVLPTVAYRNRDQNRDFRCGTVTETVSEEAPAWRFANCCGRYLRWPSVVNFHIDVVSRRSFITMLDGI